MCHRAQSWHRGIHPLAAPKDSCCFASARSCQTLRACLWVTLANTNWPCLTPWASISSTATAFLVAGCKRDVPLLAALLWDSLQPGQRGAGAVELGALVSSEENWGKRVADQVHHSLNSASSHGTPMPPPDSASRATLWAGVRSTKHDFQLQGTLSPVRPKRY